MRSIFYVRLSPPERLVPGDLLNKSPNPRSGLYPSFPANPLSLNNQPPDWALIPITRKRRVLEWCEETHSHYLQESKRPIVVGRR